MHVSNTSPLTGNVTATSLNAAGSSSAPSSFQSMLSQLTDYVNETPAQRMQASILAQLGITPRQLAAMSPADRAKVETEVKELMKKEMQAQEQQQQAQSQAQIQQQVQAVQVQLQLPTSQANMQSGTQPSTQPNTQSSPKHNTTISL